MPNKIVSDASVLISQLPDSYYGKSELLGLVEDPNSVTVSAVVVSSSIGKAVYIGYPTLRNVRLELHNVMNIVYNCKSICTPTQVAKLGNLVDRETAKQLFPNHF